MKKDFAVLEAMVIGYKEIASRLNAVVEDSKKHGGAVMVQHWAKMNPIPISTDAVIAIINYYKSEIERSEKEIAEIKCNRISNAKCSLRNGTYTYSAQYGPLWLMGNTEQAIHAYSTDPSLDAEAVLADDYVIMPTWKDIIYSIIRDEEHDTALDCKYRILATKFTEDLDFPCNIP